MKKRYFVLAMLVVCMLLVGCGKSGTKDSSSDIAKPIEVIPDPNDYFSGADISLVRNDEKSVYYMIKKYSKEDYDKYLEACTSSIFTNTTYSTKNDRHTVNYINSSDGQYRLNYTMNNDNEIIDIICNVLEPETEQ